MFLNLGATVLIVIDMFRMVSNDLRVGSDRAFWVESDFGI